MKIGVVCYPTFGGSGVVATELGIELSKKGHEVHFITYSQPVRLDALSSNLHYHEVNVPDYPLFKYEPYELALSSKLMRLVRSYLRAVSVWTTPVSYYHSAPNSFDHLWAATRQTMSWG